MRNTIRWILLLAIPILIFLVLSQALCIENQKVSLTSNASTEDALAKVINIQKEGGMLLLDSSGLNELLKIYLKNGTSYKSFLLREVNADINNGYITLMAPVKYRSINFMLSTKGQIYLMKNNNSDNKIVYKLNSFYVGKLPISPELVHLLIKDEGFREFKFQENSIIVDISNMPFEIEDAGLKDKRLYIYVKKSEVDKTDNTPEPKVAQSQKKELKETHENTSQSSKKTKQNSTKDKSANINNGLKENLLALNNQLENVKTSLGTASQRKIVSMLQSTIQKLIYNPSYNYEMDEVEVRALYYNLTARQKTDLKSAIILNVNPDNIKELMNNFIK